MNFKESVSTVSGVCFLFALAFYVFFNEYLIPDVIKDSRTLSVVISIFSSLGIYRFAFSLFFQIYSKFLYKKLNTQLDISGEWYQIMLIDREEDPGKKIRHGVCNIDADVDQIQMSGQNHKLDEEHSFSSLWQSTAVSLKNRQLHVLFRSHGVYRPNGLNNTSGTMLYQISGSPPDQLNGTFYDVVPGKNSGVIIIYRDKTEYINELKRFSDLYGIAQ